MNISLLTVSVGYAEQLSRSLDLWKSADDVLVVTSPGDLETQRLCVNRGVKIHITDRFYIPGAVFNKAGSLAEGYSKLSPNDWALIVDADVIPPPGWREAVEKVEPGYLYGARRIDESGKLIADATVVGFFMLFHVSDPRIPTPIFGDWHNAGSYDSEFEMRWRGMQRILPITLRHIGEHGRNWCGIGNDEGMRQMRVNRLSKGWRAERLTHGK